MPDRLSRMERLRIVAELCPRHGSRRACDSYAAARERALAILGPAGRVEPSADWVLMRAIDRFTSGLLSLEDLYRCRILAYYMTFATGGEEWVRWGVAAGVRPGDFPEPLDDLELDELQVMPEGPPWRMNASGP